MPGELGVYGWLEALIYFMCPISVQSCAVEVYVSHTSNWEWAEPCQVGWGQGEGHTDTFPLPGCWLTCFRSLMDGIGPGR